MSKKRGNYGCWHILGKLLRLWLKLYLYFYIKFWSSQTEAYLSNLQDNPNSMIDW
jgi:hypothetical protein